MSQYIQASDMRLDGFLVFPFSCSSEVKGWLVWLLGAGRCNGVRPFFIFILLGIGVLRLFGLAQDEFLDSFIFDVTGGQFEKAAVGRRQVQILELDQSGRRADFNLKREIAQIRCRPNSYVVMFAIAFRHVPLALITRLVTDRFLAQGGFGDFRGRCGVGSGAFAVGKFHKGPEIREDQIHSILVRTQDTDGMHGL